ncbi:MAG: ImmA/IrrE family metallo-endopeptidase [Terriglobales bacterium]
MKYTDALEKIEPYQKTAPVDVVKIAERFGLTVWESSDLPPGISGKLFRDNLNGGESGYSILVNKAESSVRRRFTAAHEIGHFLLHRDRIGQGISDDEWYRGGLTSAEEAEANRLAADILMPRALILDFQNRGFDDAVALASIFKVSKAAMRIRLGD